MPIPERGDPIEQQRLLREQEAQEHDRLAAEEHEKAVRDEKEAQGAAERFAAAQREGNTREIDIAKLAMDDYNRRAGEHYGLENFHHDRAHDLRNP